MNIRTEYVYPPIPIRSFDWSAVDDDTYDGPGSPVGTGATEQEAISDLAQQLEDRCEGTSAFQRVYNYLADKWYAVEYGQIEPADRWYYPSMIALERIEQGLPMFYDPLSVALNGMPDVNTSRAHQEGNR